MQRSARLARNAVGATAWISIATRWLARRVLMGSSGDTTMSKLLRGAAAGFGAWKLGGGLISTVLVFVLLWWILGHFGIFQ
jgi:hypothetical protein